MAELTNRADAVLRRLSRSA